MVKNLDIVLNAGQRAASDGFFEFLLGEENEIIISGAGGVGKTFTMGYMIDQIMPRYFEMCKMLGIPVQYDQVVMCATTNKAAEVLSLATDREAITIHSFLNLKVQDDYRTGRTTLSKNGNWRVHQNMIIFIDECSMIDSPLRNMLQEGTFNCKIVYVGDHSQLAPVMETLSPIYRDNLKMFELTEPMRTDKQALLDVNQQLRETVATGEFKPIQIVPGVIDLLNDDEALEEIDQVFIDPEVNARILAYTNSRVLQYNDYIRNLRNLPDDFIVGEHVINNSAVRIGKSGLSVEQEVEIIARSEQTEVIKMADGAELVVARADLETRLGGVFSGVPLPVDRDHYNALSDYYRNRKNWVAYFHLKNTYPDLRQRDACTVHKSQGSSYDTTYIDLTNLSTCRNPALASRLMYVAFSRARNRVVLFGKLAPKFGGLIEQ